MRILSVLPGIAAILLLVNGCRKADSLNTNVTPITIVVTTEYGTQFRQYNFDVKNTQVTLLNTTTGAELTGQTDDAGIVIFPNVPAAHYKIFANKKIDKLTFETATGLEINEEEVNFNASVEQLLNPSTTNKIGLSLTRSRIGDFVLKQIYYAGSHTVNGAVFRDQFIEIYNNSNELLYADSLYFGQLAGNNTKYDNVDISKGYYVTENQDGLYKAFNWGMSIGMQPADSRAYTDYVYMKSLFRIPGNGTTYPVAPGESIIIAATAQNHKAPFKGTDDKEVSVKNPDLTVDLSIADFEVYLGDVIPNAFASDVDNTTVPNVVVIETGGNRDLILDATGRDAYVLFKSDKPFPSFGNPTDPNGYPLFPDPTITDISSSTSMYYQIPNDILIDAVQIINPAPTSNSRVARKLSNALDAGPVHVPGGQYSSQSLIRKTAKTVNGIKVLMDTNNSATDFDFFEMADPKGFKD